MIFYAIVLFSLAVVFGLSLIFIGVRYRRGSLALGLGHAGIAITGLVVLVVAIFREPAHHLLYNNAALLFVLALAGGLVLLALREGRKPPSMIVVGIHAVMALFALYLLVRGYLGT
jgi:hypothetical protein